MEDRKSESLLVNNISDEERSLKVLSAVSETPSPDKKVLNRQSVSALSQVSLLKDSVVKDKKSGFVKRKDQSLLQKPSKTNRDHRKSISNLHQRDSDDNLNTSVHSIQSARNSGSEVITNT